MIRDDIKAALVGAMKAGDTAKRDAIRLIQAALKNRDIELRGSANPPEDDVLVTEVLQKMVKQRRESIEMYNKGGRAKNVIGMHMCQNHVAHWQRRDAADSLAQRLAHCE